MASTIVSVLRPGKVFKLAMAQHRAALS